MENISCKSTSISESIVARVFFFFLEMQGHLLFVFYFPNHVYNGKTCVLGTCVSTDFVFLFFFCIVYISWYSGLHRPYFTARFLLFLSEERRRFRICGWLLVIILTTKYLILKRASSYWNKLASFRFLLTFIYRVKSNMIKYCFSIQSLYSYY